MPTDRPTAVEPDLLHALAASFDDAAGALDRLTEPALLRVRTAGRRAGASAASAGADTADIEIGVKHLDPEGPGPVEALLGFDAPADWAVLGVLVQGTARDLGDGHRRPPGRRARIVHLVARSGACAWSIRVEADPPLRGDAGDAAGAPDGRLDDACRRALGLPTAPAPPSTVELWSAMWLDAVLARAADPATRPTSWAALEGLHPAAAALDAASAQAVVERPGLVTGARLLARAKPWEQLRRDCIEGRWHVPDVPAELARWMDDGMFSRTVSSAFPPVAVLADMVTDVLPPALARRVTEALAAWGVA